MKKVLNLLFFLVVSLSLGGFNHVYALEKCSDKSITMTVSPNPVYTQDGDVDVKITVNLGASTIGITYGNNYHVTLEGTWAGTDINSDTLALQGPEIDNVFTAKIPQGSHADYQNINLRDESNHEFCGLGSTLVVASSYPAHCTNDKQDVDETGCNCGGSCMVCPNTTYTCPAAPPPDDDAAAAPATCDPESGFGDPGTGVPTGLGCIPTEPENLVKWILKYAILMGGGIAFLLSVFGGVSIILAGGNPEKINAGKEIIGSALTGLLFIIFSVFLLRFIGYDILQLPGFSNPWAN